MSIDGLLQQIVFQNGLIPAVIVEADGQVLTLCYLNREALERTLETGLVHVFRRSRGEVMLKGEISGHTQRLKEVRTDCEGKSLMLVVEQKLAACHAGYRTCYYRRYRPAGDSMEVCAEKVFDPDTIYGSSGLPAREDGSG